MNALTAKVHAVNETHKCANELYWKLTRFFRPYVGKAVLTKTGQILAKIQALMPELPDNKTITVYRHCSDYSLAWTVKACVNTDNITVYNEVTIYIADLSNGTITKLCESYQEAFCGRTDYTVDEVIANREAAAKAKKAYDEARAKCRLFENI